VRLSVLSPHACLATHPRAQAEGAAKAQAEIGKYSLLKKRLLSGGAEGEPLQSSVVQSLNKANAALFETLMELEMSQVRLYLTLCGCGCASTSSGGCASPSYLPCCFIRRLLIGGCPQLTPIQYIYP
jgi:hypothetical protein